MSAATPATWRPLAGYGRSCPLLGGLALVVTLSSMGLPGLNGFVGEFTILLGAFGSQAIGSPWFAGVATLGVILAAVYLLVLFRKSIPRPGQPTRKPAICGISTRARVLILLPLLVLIFWIGLYPKPFFRPDQSHRPAAGCQQSRPLRWRSANEEAIMTEKDLIIILPPVIVAAWAIILLLVDLWIPRGRKGITALLAAFGLAIALGVNLALGGSSGRQGPGSMAWRSWMALRCTPIF